MLTVIKAESEHSYKWIDISGPSLEELTEVAEKYHLHPTAVKDCLEPEHLPKIEQTEEASFIIFRFYDKHCNKSSDTIQKLTRKLAIFYGKNYLITIHRSETDIINQTAEKYANNPYVKTPFDIVCKLLKQSIETYEAPLTKIDNEIDYYESRIFLKNRIPDLLKNLYEIKRKAYITKRLFSVSKNIVDQMESSNKKNAQVQDLKDTFTKYEILIDEIHDSIYSLLNIYISLSSQKTNEVMRFLTVFSAFFLPLTFIVGIYGMNFDGMPELHWIWGYPSVLGFMLSITIFIWIWFKRKGWM
jgi:magnesium transporter